jgi:hypothetical protein
MKNIGFLIITVALFVVSSCGKNFGDLNTDPNNPSQVPVSYLITNAEKAFATQNGNLSPGSIWAQYWAQNNYTDVSRYAFFSSFDWYYVEILQDLREIQRLIAESPDAASARSKNQMAVAKILEIAVFHELTDIFGPIP